MIRFAALTFCDRVFVRKRIDQNVGSGSECLVKHQLRLSERRDRLPIKLVLFGNLTLRTSAGHSAQYVPRAPTWNCSGRPGELVVEAKRWSGETLSSSASVQLTHDVAFLASASERCLEHCSSRFVSTNQRISPRFDPRNFL